MHRLTIPRLVFMLLVTSLAAVPLMLRSSAASAAQACTLKACYSKSVCTVPCNDCRDAQWPQAGSCTIAGVD